MAAGGRRALRMAEAPPRSPRPVVPVAAPRRSSGLHKAQHHLPSRCRPRFATAPPVHRRYTSTFLSSSRMYRWIRVVLDRWWGFRPLRPLVHDIHGR